jgi:hypothetical protein
MTEKTSFLSLLVWFVAVVLEDGLEQGEDIIIIGASAGVKELDDRRKIDGPLPAPALALEASADFAEDHARCPLGKAREAVTTNPLAVGFREYQDAAFCWGAPPCRRGP